MNYDNIQIQKTLFVSMGHFKARRATQNRETGDSIFKSAFEVRLSVKIAIMSSVEFILICAAQELN